MNYDDDMTTPLDQLRPTVQFHNDVYQPNNGEQLTVPQSTLQRAPPMRFGMTENFKTHQTINSNLPSYPTIPNNFQNNIPQNYPNNNFIPRKKNRIINRENNGKYFENLFGGLYNRIKEPVIITLLFIILAHRLVVKSINPIFPFVGEVPSVDLVSLSYRGFILAVVFMIIRNLI